MIHLRITFAGVTSIASDVSVASKYAIFTNDIYYFSCNYRYIAVIILILL